jgi:hypothetical protein
MAHLRFLYFITIILLYTFNSSFAQDNWTKFKTNGELAFSVDVPGAMVKSTKSLKTALGELEALTYAYQGNEEDANYLYLINIVQYPEETFPIDSTDLIEEFITNAVESSRDRVKGSLVYSAPIERENGKLFRIKYNDGDAIIKGKIFVRKDVFVSIQVFTIEDKSLNDEMDIFLDSFKMKF